MTADIELGGGLTVIDDRRDVDDALLQVGFEALETRDLAERTGPSIPLVSTACRIGPILCRLSQFIDRALRHPQLTARLGSAPHRARGTVRVSQTLNLCAAAIAEAGRLGIFSPMYLIHGRKPG